MKTIIETQTNRKHKSRIYQNPQQAVRIFQRAVDAYNKEQVYNALQTARYALQVARRTNEYSKAYICGFLAQLKWELCQFQLAKNYCLQAIQSLEKFHIDYQEDKNYYESLYRTIESNQKN